MCVSVFKSSLGLVSRCDPITWGVRPSDSKYNYYYTLTILLSTILYYTFTLFTLSTPLNVINILGLQLSLIYIKSTDLFKFSETFTLNCLTNFHHIKFFAKSNNI